MSGKQSAKPRLGGVFFFLRLNFLLDATIGPAHSVGAAEGCDLVLLKIKSSQPAAAPTGGLVCDGLRLQAGCAIALAWLVGDGCRGTPSPPLAAL